MCGWKSVNAFFKKKRNCKKSKKNSAERKADVVYDFVTFEIDTLTL